MRTARFLLLIVYVAGHTGLPLPLPASACAPGACGCGDACQCAQEKIAAGNCCCATQSQAPKAQRSCCAKAAESCCETASTSKSCCDNDQQRPRLPVLRPCGCQQEAPEGIAACSDPRVPPARSAPPRARCCGRLSPAGGPAVPLLVQSPDDPVPRLTA